MKLPVIFGRTSEGVPASAGGKRNGDTVKAPEIEAYNVFYGRISSFYRIIGVLFLLLFISYSITFLLRNTSDVTYSKLDYLVRNFAMKLDENTERSTEIIYNPDASMKFTLFGNGIAVGGNSGVTVFSATGRKICASDTELKNPYICAGDRYVLACDAGGTSYYLYNSFTRVYSGTSDYPLLGAAAADDGSYILITRDDEYTSAVLLYNRDFELKARYLKNGYIIAADISPDGSSVLTATVGTDSSGSYETVIEISRTGEDSAAVSVTLGDFPLICRFTSSGFGAVCREAVYSFDSSGTQLCCVPYNDRSLSDARVSDDGFCIVLPSGSVSLGRRNDILLYDWSGRLLGSTEEEENITDICMFGKSAYILAESTVISLTAGGTGYTGLPEAISPKAILVYSEGKGYICCNSAAYAMSFGTEGEK